MPIPDGTFTPMPAYFYIKINKQKQQERKEKQGNLYIVTDSKNEARNMQQGEIVSIGEYAASLFPYAKVGMTLVIHWMTESKEKKQLVNFDDDYNYYVVTATEYNGQANQSYGVWDGENIIPHPDYIFLEKNKDNRELKQTDSGLFLFDNWTETRTDKEEKMAALNAEIQSLTKSKMNSQLRDGIARKEKELEGLSNSINKQRIELYTVAAINPDFNEMIENSFGHKVEIGDKVGMLNAACQTTVEFNGIEYIVALSKHFHLTERWAKESIKKYKGTVETVPIS